MDAPHPIDELRYPVLSVLVAAVLLPVGLQWPGWTGLAAAAVAGTAWALAWRRTLIAQLFARLRPGLAAVGCALAAGLYVLWDLGVTTAVSPGGTGASPAVLAAIAEWRAHLPTGPTWAVGAGVALAAAGEEIFWRGFVMTRLMGLWRHGTAAFVTAVAYAALYYLTMGLLGAATAFMLGVLTAQLTLRARSLWPAVLTHAAFATAWLWWHPAVVS